MHFKNFKIEFKLNFAYTYNPLFEKITMSTWNSLQKQSFMIKKKEKNPIYL